MLRGPGSVPPCPGRCGCGTGSLDCARAIVAAVRKLPAAAAVRALRREIGFIISSLNPLPAPRG
jgi:hypothetical protein